jgi:hypothetical protein
MNAAMNEDPQVRIQYMAKANGIANYWKKMIGESRGINRIDAVAKKELQDQQFKLWADADAARKSRYGELTTAFQVTCQQFLPLDLSSIYITEAAQGIEVVRFAAGFRELAKISKEKHPDESKLNQTLENLRRISKDFYKNWQPVLDRKVMAVMLSEISEKMNPKFKPLKINEIAVNYRHDFNLYAHDAFEGSFFTDSTRLYTFLKGYKTSQVKKLEKDPVFSLAQNIYACHENKILPELTQLQAKVDSLQRLYMAGLMEMKSGNTLYPDANGTLRVAFGKVDDYEPADAVKYNYYTTLSGVMQKEDSAIYDYRVEPALKKLYLNKDFGRYSDRDGTMHVAFTASNHTTGGNSGSPVLNADGQMIGINFDRNWEGTLSDLMYDPSQCRNISLDIRYCLFIIDKVYGNRHLIEELKIVN